MNPVLRSNRPFFDRLYAGTLRSLGERVAPSGFCRTSFGEEGGVQTYIDCHYPRDAAEAAQVLADTGETEKAFRILEFNLRNVPSGQEYIPHVYDAAGRVTHNNLQTDTPAHSARALEILSRNGADEARVAALYHALDRFMEALHRTRYRAEFRLLDSGNFNEQGFGGTREPLLDLFSNTACHAGFTALGAVAARLGDSEAARKHADRAEQLALGIETRLFDPAENRYSAAVTPSGERLKLYNWLSIYPYRFYEGRADAWSCAFEHLWRETANRWGEFQIPSCEPPHLSLRTLGKVVALLLQYCAETGRLAKLAELLDFIEATVRRPADLWPEFWYHHAPGPEDSPYFRDLFAAHPGIWTPFTEDPAGDHTVDSGNCEQSAVFCGAFLNHVLGCRTTETGVILAPMLPDFRHAALLSRPLPGGGALSWELEQFPEQRNFSLHRTGAVPPLELRLAVPSDAVECTLRRNGAPYPLERYRHGECDLCRIRLSSPSREMEELELHFHLQTF